MRRHGPAKDEPSLRQSTALCGDPDGSLLTFFSNKSGSYQGWSIRRDGGDRTLLTAVPDNEFIVTAITPDGRSVFASLLDGGWAIGPTPGPLTPQSAKMTKAPTVGAGVFFPTNVSRDGRWLTGCIDSPSGEWAGNALYDLASGAVKQLCDDPVGELLTWMPDQTRVLYFTANGKLMIQDIATLERHEIDVKLPLPPDEDMNVVASYDGRTIYYGARQTEANIWKVEAAGKGR